MTPADAWRNQQQQSRTAAPPPATARLETPGLQEPLPSSLTPTATATPHAADRPEDRVQLDWLDALVRHRRWAFGFVVLIYALSFNGLWRVGLDSALYRSLAHSLATGRGYTVAGEPHHHAFPGMPLLLAGIERVFGSGDLVPTLVVTLMAFAMLALTYRLIALRFPAWVAVVVTVGVGLNFRVVRQSQELMTDIPFALGVVAAFYGLERLRLAARIGPLWRRGNLVPALTMMGGLALAAAMRPTFGVLGGAILLAAIYRLFVNADGRRALHIAIVGGVCTVTAILAFTDPRTSGRTPFKGGVYEQELIDGVRDLHRTIWKQLDDLLARDLNDAFYSQDMAVNRIRIGPIAPIGAAFSVVLLAATVCVLRRDLGWGLAILGIMAITLPLSTVPRYFIMVMPFLWLGWVALMSNLTLRVAPAARGATMMIGLLIPVGMNVGRIGGLIIEQRSAEMGVIRGRAPDRATAFYQTFREGLVPHLQAVAAMIHEHVPPAARVIGPEANVLAYYADRRVFGERAIFMDRPVRQYPTILRDWNPAYAVFPAAQYTDADSRVRDLINRRILVKGETIARVGKAYLTEVSVRVPRDLDNWQRNRRTVATTPPATAAQPTTASTQPAKKKAKKPAATRPTAGATTRSSVRPGGTHTSTTQPATKPSKKGKKKAAHPTTQVTHQPATSRPTGNSGKSAADLKAAREAREKREARERRDRAAAAATTKPTR